MQHELPPDFSSLKDNEKIKFILPGRIERIKYYGFVALAVFKSIPRDVLHGLASTLKNESTTRNFQAEYLHQADVRLFDMAVNNGTVKLNPESLLDEDWKSELDS